MRLPPLPGEHVVDGRGAMTTATDPRYWVNHCEGFDVEWDGARIGVVEDVVRDESGEAEALHVRGGLFGTDAYEVPMEDITDVLPSRVRLVVQRAPRRFHPDMEGMSVRERIRAALEPRAPG
jgi:hypothetical protein